MIIPVTYMILILFFVLTKSNDSDYWTRFLAKMLGAILGIWIGIKTFNGEYWATDATNTIVITQIKDGFELPLALIIIAISLYMWVSLYESIQRQDYNKTPNEST